MNRVLAAALLVTGAMLAASPAAAAPYQIEPAQTRIAFAVGAQGYPVTRGEFRQFRANLAIDAATPARSQVAFTVDAASIDTRAPLIDEYVRGRDLLDVARHPAISFRSTAVRQVGENAVEVRGALTLLGVTRPETFRVTVKPEGGAYALTAVGTIRRSDFGMMGGLPLVSDTVTITVSTRATAS